LLSHQPLRRALYLQVRDLLAGRIARREWAPGFAVPNEVDLARELGVSAGTVRKALHLMEQGRLVTRRQGKGTFVKDQATNGAAARFNKLRGPDGDRVSKAVRPVDITEGAADESECERLGLQAGAGVLRLRWQRRVGAQNVLIEDATLPATLFPGLRDTGAICDDISVLALEHGILLGKAEERISIDVAAGAVAETLGVAAGTRVMKLDRVICMLDGPPVEWRVAYCYLARGFYLAELS
jgi:GntR family transcriptional regulator